MTLTTPQAISYSPCMRWSVVDMWSSVWCIKSCFDLLCQSILSKDKALRPNHAKRWKTGSSVLVWRIPGNHRGLFDSAESLKNCLSSVSKQHRLSNVLLFPCKTWAPELPQMGMDWRESHLVPESGGLWPHWLARIEKENMLYWGDVSFMDSSSNLVFSCCLKLYLFSSF